nr:hypothetical protein Q903MT_gene6054 [Picea sitchensis]
MGNSIQHFQLTGFICSGLSSKWHWISLDSRPGRKENIIHPSPNLRPNVLLPKIFTPLLIVPPFDLYFRFLT